MNVRNYASVMRLFLILMINVLIISSCGDDNKKSIGGDTDEKKAPGDKEMSESENFIINYDMQGMMRGKMDIMKKGDRMKQIINSNIMGLNTTNTIIILNNTAYSVTEATGQKFATKSDIKEYNSKKQTGETIVDFKEFEKFLAGKTIKGNENILGYNCDVYDVGGGLSMAVYQKKYILKINNPEFMAVATKIDVNPVFAANEFDLPADVDFNNPKKGVDGKTLDSLIKQNSK